jgi:hypothetical protein
LIFYGSIQVIFDNIPSILEYLLDSGLLSAIAFFAPVFIIFFQAGGFTFLGLGKFELGITLGLIVIPMLIYILLQDFIDELPSIILQIGMFCVVIYYGLIIPLFSHFILPLIMNTTPTGMAVQLAVNNIPTN